MQFVAPILALAALAWCWLLAWLGSFSMNKNPLALVPAVIAVVACAAAWRRWRYVLMGSTAGIAAGAFAQGVWAFPGSVSEGVVMVVIYLPALTALVLANISVRLDQSRGAGSPIRDLTARYNPERPRVHDRIIRCVIRRSSAC